MCSALSWFQVRAYEGERCTRRHSLSTLIPIKWFIHRHFLGETTEWRLHLSLPYVCNKMHSHRSLFRHTERKRQRWSVVCLLYQRAVARPGQKAPGFWHTMLLAGYFWCPGGGEGWKASHKGKNVVPVVVLGGHGRVDVGVGCLPFDIGWPLGCMSQGLLLEEGWKWVFIGEPSRGQGEELC